MDPSPCLQNAGMNVILTTCFATRINSADDQLFKDIMAYVHASMKMAGPEGDLCQFFPIMSVLDILVGKKRKYSNFIAKVRDPLFTRLIDEAASSDKDSMIKSFLALKEEYGLDDKDIIVTMSDLLGAGADTAAATLSWMIVILSHHHDVQEKIQAELDAFIRKHNRLSTFEERDQIPYTIAVQKECIRYKSIGFFGFPHMASRDVAVRDYFIPKGTILLGNVNGMHMNPKVYSDPETFKPERFLNNTRTMSSSANGNINQRDHFVFGWGRRLCPGIHLAEVEMFHIFVRILANSTIAAPLNDDGKEVAVDMDITVNIGPLILPQPYQVRFIPRTDSPLK
ncbi:cytochrome P450 [Halteromyces radiatus]|nr:cytochrome P450 [Halteromyces radiatus]KAI8075990.1 cytochrome P450 [Halteromyces radiatus]